MPNHPHITRHSQAQEDIAQSGINREILQQALAHYQTLCRQHPNQADIWYALAGINAQLGRLEDVEHCCRRVIAQQADNTAARYNLGVALQQQGKNEEAVSCYQELLKIKPEHAAAHANLGLLYHENKNPAGAETHSRQAIALEPDKVAAHNTLGLVHLEQERYSEAIDCFQRAIRLQPEYTQGHYNLGLALLRSDAPEAAAGCFHQALALEPHNPDALNEMGSACKAMGNYEQALKFYTSAVQANPEHADAHWNRSLVLLLMGSYAEGWKEYEWRWRSANRRPREIAGPAWRGEPLSGRRILIYNEQGLGDGIQFIRYSEQLKALGALVIAEVPAELSRILATCAGIDQVIVQGEDLPAFDFHASLMSLPGLMNTREETIPANIPYIHPREDSNTAISSLFAKTTRRLKVGIVWAGNPQHTNDRNRSCPVRYFSAISRLPGIQLFSLQKGLPEQELDAIKSADPVINLAPHLHDFADSAQAMAHLDVLITVDTSVAHLAGAMGRPVWLLLPYVPDWRWQLSRTDSPWYPSMNLFRQQHPGDWAGVFKQVRKRLLSFAESRKTGIIT